MRNRNSGNRRDRYPGPRKPDRYRGNREDQDRYEERYYEARHDNDYWRQPESRGMREFEMDRDLTGHFGNGYYSSRREDLEEGTYYPSLSSNDNRRAGRMDFQSNDYYYDEYAVPESAYHRGERPRPRRKGYSGRGTTDYHDQRTVDGPPRNDYEWEHWRNEYDYLY